MMDYFLLFIYHQQVVLEQALMASASLGAVERPRQRRQLFSPAKREASNYTV